MEELKGFEIQVTDVSETTGQALAYTVFAIVHQFGVGNYVDYENPYEVDETSTDRYTDLDEYFGGYFTA